jgi:hypothetical protein
VRIVSADPADAVLAGQRASALRSWLGGPGQVRVPIQATDTNADQPHLDVLIRR